MNLKNYGYKFLGFFFFVTFISGCFDKPEPFVSPTWDLEVNIPITTKEFSLLEIVEKDSSFLKSSDDPQNLGLIYFGDTQFVSTITVEDELRLNPFQTYFSQVIGPIKVNVPLPSASNIRVEDWTTDIQSGSTQIFPEQEGNVTLDINGVQTVERIFLDEGDLSLVVFNNLPVYITLRGIILRNKIDQSVIAERSNIKSNWLKIPPFRVDTIFFPLQNVEVTNQLEYIGTIYSIGSDGDEVIIPQEAGTTVIALFNHMIISSATAALPIQNMEFTKSIILDDSTQIETAEIEYGSASILMNNNMDVNVNTKITFNNLYDTSGKQYFFTVPLLRNEKAKRVNLPNLYGWEIKSAIPGVPSNEISYNVEIVTDSTGEVSTISKDDSISFNLNFNQLVFKTFTGRLKPTPFHFNENGFHLNLSDFNNQFNFQKIIFKNAKINLDLQTSSNLKFLINGELSSTNGSTTNTIPLENILLPSASAIKIDISKLLNGYTTDLPDNFTMKGNGYINPTYELGTIASGDSVFGSMNFEIPLNVGISSATFLDTIEINLGEVNADDLERINYGEITFEVNNGVPVGIKFSAVVLDSNYSEVLYLPTEYNEMEFLTIPSPAVSAQGEVISAGTTEQTLILYNEDIRKFIKNPFLKIIISFETASNNGNNVKFRTTNSFSFSVRGKASYRAQL